MKKAGTYRFLKNRRLMAALALSAFASVLLTGCSNATENGSQDISASEPSGGSSAESDSKPVKATKEDVESANKNAVNIMDSLAYWEMNLLGRDYKYPPDVDMIVIEGRPDPDGKQWIGNVSAHDFKAEEGGNAAAVESLKDLLAQDLKSEKDITAIVWVCGNMTIGCVYCDFAVDPYILANTFSFECFRSHTYEWDGKTDGIVGDVPGLSGKAVGTYPKLVMKKS